MTSTLAARAVAIDVRHEHTGALLSVALVVPSERYLALLAEGADRPEEPTLTARAWREIDAWIADGDTGLPARPPPLGPAVVALLGRERRSVVARRFASIPFLEMSRTELALLAEPILSELLKARRSAA